MYDGMLAISKDKGLTSHDVVNRVRRILGQKKIGHTGTLDPMAEGVLPVCLGSGTKLTELFVGDDKQYRAVIRLGMTTDTQDMTGEVLSTCDDLPDEEQIREVVSGFLGEQMQLPPMYSAVKVNGRKLYQYARAGVEVERKARKIVISSIRVEQTDLPYVTVLVDCSKGTYIRTLCQDIGDRLGCGGVLSQLTRTRSGSFLLEDCISLAQLAAMETEEIRRHVIPVEAFFPRAGKARVTPEANNRLLNGNPILPEELAFLEEGEDKNLVRMYDTGDTFVGLYRRKHQNGLLRPEKMYLPYTG